MSWLKARSRPSTRSPHTVPSESNHETKVTPAVPRPVEPAPPEETESKDSEPHDEWFLALKRRLHHEVVSNMDHTKLSTMSDEQLREAVRKDVEQFCQDHAHLIEVEDQERLVKQVLDETFGLGPLEELMADSSISDILINGPKSVYIERHGRLQKTKIQFHDDDHVVHIVQRIAAQTGRRVDETRPTVDARLPDGSRLNAVIPPIAIDGPLVSIRRFGARPLTTDVSSSSSLMTCLHATVLPIPGGHGLLGCGRSCY